MRRAGHQVLYQSTKKRHWRKALKDSVDLVIAAGGDGTVRKTAWEVMGSGVPLAIFPLGTANNLARSLGFNVPVDGIIQSLHGGNARPFDVAAARIPSRTNYFLEAAGGGLFADYFPAAEAREKKGASPKEQLATNTSLLRELALNYRTRLWKMTADGDDISDRYILWGAMNIRSAGPALHLAPNAAPDDGRLDFVAVREDDREIFIKHLEAQMAGRKERIPLAPRKFRELKITSAPGAIHLDGEKWPGKKRNNSKSAGAIEITIKPAALTIWQLDQ